LDSSWSSFAGACRYALFPTAIDAEG
jgi:hypothetical protein